MKVIVMATVGEFEDKEMRLSVEEIEMMKMVDAIEDGDARYKIYELVYDMEGKRFVLWLDKE